MQLQEKSRFGILFCRFLYVVGIQSVRILKRVNRKIAKFFRSAFCSAVAFCRRYITAAKAEGARVREGFQIAEERIGNAWKKGPLPAVGEFFRSAGKSVRRHRHGLIRVFNIAAPVVGVCVLVSTVQNWTNRDYGLLLQHGEQTIAVLKDEKTFQQAEEMVNMRRMSSTFTGGAYTPRYTMAMTNAANYTSPAMLCDALIANSGEHIVEAVGLYIDGELIGALKSQADLTFLLQERLNQGRGEDRDASVSFVQQIEQVEGLYPVENIITGAELREILNRSSQEEVYYTVQPNDTLTAIAAAYNMDLEDLTALNPDIIPEQMRDGDLVKIQQEKPFLNVQVVRREEYDAPVAYATVATQDENEYTDYSLVTQEGQEGEQHCVDRVVYIDGVETSRETIERTVTKEPVDKLVIVGTKLHAA